MPSKKPVTVFYSYSHKDEALRNELDKHLSSLKQEGLIQAWHDRRITPGDEWKNQIDDNLKAAQLILLLISSDFMASGYCVDIEMKQAMKLHKTGKARIVPIILRPVDWTKARFAALQALPTDGKPVTEWPNQDSAFLNVAQGIRRAVEVFQPKVPKSTRRIKNASTSAGNAGSTANAGTVIQGDVKVNKGDVVFGNKIDQMNIDMSGRKK